MMPISMFVFAQQVQASEYEGGRHPLRNDATVVGGKTSGPKKIMLHPRLAWFGYGANVRIVIRRRCLLR